MAKDRQIFNSFKGLWSRGPVDSCPLDHSTVAQNVKFTTDGITIRDGTSDVLVFGANNLIKMHIYKPNPPYVHPNVPRPIVLDNTGKLWDPWISTATPILNNAAILDFDLVNMFGRAYITVSDGKTGLSGFNLYIYDGTGSVGMRNAGGDAATTAITVGAGGVGVLGPGTYAISVANETASGFITAPATFVSFDALPSANQALTVPVGPAGTAARWVISTKAIPLGTYNGNAQEYPIYFVARIADNVTTAYTMDFYDENLSDSADYLLTRIADIPCGVGLVEYNGRLISYGEYDNPSMIRASEPGEPESFSSTSGYQVIDPPDSVGIKSAVEFRGTLYVAKINRLYATQDDGSDISNWQFVNIDKATGTDSTHGFAQVLDAKGASSDGFLIADRRGIVYFDGTLLDPPLTYKIEDFWKRINFQYGHILELHQDPHNKIIYIICPLDSSIVHNMIIIGDYREGLTAKDIKWSTWSIDVAGKFPDSIAGHISYATGNPLYVMYLTRGNTIIKIDSSVRNDSNLDIHEQVEFPIVRFGSGLSHFSKIKMKIGGQGNIEFIAYGQDKTTNYTYPSTFTLVSAAPGREYDLPINLVNEECRLLIKLNNNPTLNDYFKLNRLEIYGQELWARRAG